MAVTVVALTQVQAQTVEEIVQKHIAALGGAEKLKTVNTIYFDRSIAVQGMEIPSKSTIVVGKSMRNESTVMGNSMVQVVNEGKGWKIMPAMMGGKGEPEDMTAEELKTMIGQLDPFGVLNNYLEKGNVVELVGKEKVDKKDMFHLKVTPKDGVVQDLYINASTFLVYKVTTKTNGQDGELVFNDYEEVDGIKFPSTIDMVGQRGTMTMISSKIIINGEVNQAIFAKATK